MRACVYLFVCVCVCVCVKCCELLSLYLVPKIWS